MAASSENVSMNILGVQLSNSSLIKYSALEGQLALVLELLADHSGQFEVTKKAISKLENNISHIQSQITRNKEEIESTIKTVANLDQYVKRSESALQTSIAEVKKDVAGLTKATDVLSGRITDLANDVQPRLASVEQKLESQAAELDRKFEAVYTVVEENKKDADRKISDLESRQRQNRAKIETLEKRFDDADIEGLRNSVNELEVKMIHFDKRLTEGEQRTNALEEKTVELGSQIKVVRNDLKHAVEVTIPKTYATIEEVEIIKKRMLEVVTKKELNERLDDLHAMISTFVFGELGKQRQEIMQKISVVQERLTTEIEEVARGEEVQMCVDRVQQFVHDIEDIGVAVAQHNDAIERAAANLAEMGSEFETHVEDLRQGAVDLNAQIEGIMGNMSTEVSKVVESMADGFVGRAVEKVSVIAVAKATEAANEAVSGIAKDLMSKIQAGSGGAESHGRGGVKKQDPSSKKSKGGTGQDKEGRQGSARSANSDAEEQPAEDFDLGALMDKDSSTGKEQGDIGDRRSGAAPSPSASRSESAASARAQTPSSLIKVPSVQIEQDSPPPPRAGGGAGFAGGGGGDAQIADPQLIAMEAAKEADKVKKQLLGALEGVQKALKSQLDMLQKRMMKECVMRPDLDGQLNRVSKRIADVEWNILRPNPEVLDMNYRKKMKMKEMMDPLGPFLSERRHPGYSERDAALRPKTSDSDDTMVFQYERPRGFQKTPSEAPPRYAFETKEMRVAWQEGRELRTRGSFAAMRIFGKQQNKFNSSSLMSPSMERLIASAPDDDNPSVLKRVETPPSRVPMLPKLDFVTPSDGTHPWQIPPGHKV